MFGTNPNTSVFPDGKVDVPATVTNQPSPVPGLETELISRMPVTLVQCLHEVVKTDKLGKYYVEVKDKENNVVCKDKKTVCPTACELNCSAARMSDRAPTNLDRSRRNTSVKCFVGTSLALFVTSNSSCNSRGSYNHDSHAAPKDAEEMEYM